MEKLRHYLTECESKRRRMRDRPSDAVLADLRDLLARFEEVDLGRREDGPSNDTAYAGRASPDR